MINFLIIEKGKHLYYGNLLDNYLGTIGNIDITLRSHSIEIVSLWKR